MTLLQMKYFSAVCVTGNVSKAADDLFVSRATVSRTIRELETEFGMPLFSRTSAGLIMTEAGKSLYERCLEVLRLTETLNSQIRTLRRQMIPAAETLVRIGVSPVTSKTVFPILYRRVRDSGMNVRLYPVEYNRAQSLNAVEAGIIDFNLSADSPERYPAGFHSHKLVDSRLVFCMRPDHPLAAKERLTIQDIHEEPLIFMMPNLQPDELIESQFITAGFSMHVKHRSPQLSTVQSMVAQGEGCSIQLAYAIDNGVQVVSRPLQPAVSARIQLIWNGMIPHSSAFEEFLRFVKHFSLTEEDMRQNV